MATPITLIIDRTKLLCNDGAYQYDRYDKKKDFDDDQLKVDDYLCEVAKYRYISFPIEDKKDSLSIDLIICNPEGTHFTQSVKDRLNELNITYREDW